MLKKKNITKNKVANGHGSAHSNGSRLDAGPCPEAIKENENDDAQ